MTLIQGDCVEVMRSMPEDSVDAVVTDPPYFLRFMGRKWDHAPSPSEQQRQHQEWAREALRVLKPGSYLLAFGGTRTVHRLACAIEDAGFEIRDSITWLYGSGFPKSLDVSKAIDKMAGAEREVVGKHLTPASTNRVQTMGRPEHSGSGWQDTPNLTTPATEAAKQWEGFGTALKPANEIIVCARKPLSESSLARNVLEHGTGALNIDGSRVHSGSDSELNDAREELDLPRGRWPANVVLSHSPECQRVGVKRVRGSNIPGKDAAKPNARVWSEDGGWKPRQPTTYADPDGFEEVEAWECVDGCPVRELDFQSGTLKSGDLKPYKQKNTNHYNGSNPEYRDVVFKGDQGGASRYFKTFEGEPGFFYAAKASRRERNAGLEGMPEHEQTDDRPSAKGRTVKDGKWVETGGKTKPRTNHHPTVKPLALMRYLVKLVTPPSGVVLDPFAGSGSTLVAAIQEGFEAVGIEREQEYLEIAERRVAHARAEIESQPLALEV